MKKIHIIGAGVSGLVAAIELERAGFAPVILEASDRIGGRVKTDEVEGWPLDHGFQVLLTAYPAAKRYLNYSTLDLVEFLPGAMIYDEGKQYEFGDPLRHWDFLRATAFSPLASLGDKVRVWQLSYALQQQSMERIFSKEETTTAEYLRQEVGFSPKIIENFFTAFYGGIFLDRDLTVSNRMFQFSFKMFSEGVAAIPRAGMQAIPQQLAAQLKRTEIRLNTPVQQVQADAVILEDGTRLESELSVVATDPTGLLEDYQSKAQDWKFCDNLYLEVEGTGFGQAIIGLVSKDWSIINNFHYLNDVFGNRTNTVLSVTVTKNHGLEEAELVQRLTEEFRKGCGIEVKRLLARYPIKKALPTLTALKYAPSAVDMIYRPTILLAGDYLANPSLNAAMESGRLVAGLAAERLQVLV
ncbi:MAG: NAD(P)/FAD-dependent oxidoreductase [Bacteroidota bacterium]